MRYDVFNNFKQNENYTYWQLKAIQTLAKGRAITDHTQAA